MDVILLMAMTLDGKIARNKNQLVDWTGKKDKQYFVAITRRAGVVIMGSRTFDTIGHPLPARKNIVMTRDKTRKSDNNNLVFTDQSPGQIITDLKRQGFDQAALIGGSVVNSLFAKENLITRIHVTLVPAVFGQGLSLFNTHLDLSLEYESSREIEAGHLLLTYKVVYHE
ncbi:MAG: dihydrofolate reductase family protein [Desulfotignum sp.]|nr:dihydrofolate reductase family protein [Desulfotignum sp.]MCF8125951.1 dihydrofolate reductase family protein [Desulfotignum sp.]